MLVPYGDLTGRIIGVIKFICGIGLVLCGANMYYLKDWARKTTMGLFGIVLALFVFQSISILLKRGFDGIIYVPSPAIVFYLVKVLLAVVYFLPIYVLMQPEIKEMFQKGEKIEE